MLQPAVQLSCPLCLTRGSQGHKAVPQGTHSLVVRLCTAHAEIRARTPALPHTCLVPAGSHTVLVLLENGAKVTLIDNLSNSFLRVLDHMKKLAGEKTGDMKFVQARASCLVPRMLSVLMMHETGLPCTELH